MNIEHVAIYVNDLEAEKNFFHKYFGTTSGSKYTSFHNDFSNYFLSFDSGSRLEIMNRKSMVDPPKSKYRSGFHHIAINVGDKKDVAKITRKLDDDGVIIVNGARTTGDDYYASVVLDPEHNEIEIIAGDLIGGKATSIEHVAIYVSDLEAEKNFFVNAFGALAGSKYSNFRNDFSSYFLTFDNDARLEIMTRSSMSTPPKGQYRSGFHHFAINAGDRDAVDNLTNRLFSQGVTVAIDSRKTGDGYYESVVVDPEGNEIEIIAGNPGHRD